MGYVGSKWLPKKIPHQKKTPNNEKTDDLLLQYLILNCITAKNEILYSTRTKIYGIIRKRTKTAYTMFKSFFRVIVVVKSVFLTWYPI